MHICVHFSEALETEDLICFPDNDYSQQVAVNQREKLRYSHYAKRDEIGGKGSESVMTIDPDSLWAPSTAYFLALTLHTLVTARAFMPIHFSVNKRIKGQHLELKLQVS